MEISNFETAVQACLAQMDIPRCADILTAAHEPDLLHDYQVAAWDEPELEAAERYSAALKLAHGDGADHPKAAETLALMLRRRPDNRDFTVALMRRPYDPFVLLAAEVWRVRFSGRRPGTLYSAGQA